MACNLAGARAMRGGALQELTAAEFGIDRGTQRQGVIWRHSQNVRSRWQPALNELRRVESVRWCEAAVQTLRF
jgi:hypothetical protein